MKLTKSGIILFTENYDQCVKFYRDILQLKMLFFTEELTCFNFGGSYLMVERYGKSKPKKSIAENPTCFRLNVADFESSVSELEKQGVIVTIENFDWGTVGRFYDPDGHLWQLRDAQTFDQQLFR